MANIPKRNSLSEEERLRSLYNDIPLMSDEDRAKFPKLKYQCIYGEKGEKIFGNVDKHVVSTKLDNRYYIRDHRDKKNIEKLWITDNGYVLCCTLDNLKEIKWDSNEPIGDHFVSRCNNLQTVELRGKALSDGIPMWAFRECKKLKKVIFHNTAGGPYLCADAFRNCVTLEEISIPNGIIYIGCNAFLGCTKLSKVNIPNSVTIINSCAFANCEKLTSVDIPNSVKEIDDCGFENCESLKDLKMSQGLEKIGDGVFKDCKSLTSIDIPGSLKEIRYSTFENCESLKDLKISQGVEEIHREAFENCKSLTSVNIPGSVNFIDSYAFKGCKSLKKVKVYSDTVLNEKCFYDCNKLEEITFIGDIEEIDDALYGLNLKKINVYGKITDESKKKILEQVRNRDQIVFNVLR